jgi:aspartyl/asparaginyl beta-hydroxylase (cupin superfamily)
MTDIQAIPAFKYRSNIIKAMKEEGYYQAVMSGPDSLNRVKDFLLIMERSDDPELLMTSGYPDKSLPCPCILPLFPGIHNQPFHHQTENFSWAKILESNHAAIKEEALLLDQGADFFEYGICDMPKNTWHIHLFSYMGNNIEKNCRLCPKTTEILNSLPNRCQIYPWGDALFSVLEPGAHVPPHYSVDNLRVRCTYGVVVPDGCVLRVGTTKANWQEGKALVFEDTYEHEVWHNGKSRRIVLIVDFWHPELTKEEIAVLTIGLSHARVRAELYQFLQNDSANKYNEYLELATQYRKVPEGYYQYWLSEKAA